MRRGCKVSLARGSSTAGTQNRSTNSTALFGPVTEPDSQPDAKAQLDEEEVPQALVPKEERSMSDVIEAKLINKELDGVQKVPWYIIDPTGTFVREQRRRMVARKRLDTRSRRPQGTRVLDRAEINARNVLNQVALKVLSNMTIFPAWDVIGGLALMYTAALTPFEVGFLPPPTRADEPLFVINRIVDCIFILDVIFAFFIMTPIVPKAGDPVGKSAWEMNPRALARNYVRGWFFLDVISIFPSIFDILPVISNEGPDAGGAKALRTLRALRLVKLLRLMRASRVFQRARERISLNSVTVTLISLLTQTCMLTHAYACIVAIWTTFFDSPLDTWLGTFGYCKPAGVEADGSLLTDSQGRVLAECVDVAYRYLHCLFWSVQLLTGYSITPAMGPYKPFYSTSPTSSSTSPTSPTDAAALQPEWEVQFKPTEYILLLVMLLFGVFAWTVIFGNLIVALTQADPDRKRFTEGLDALNRFCDQYKLSKEISRELRRYYFHTIDVLKYDSRMAAIEQLSPMLKQRVTWELNKHWLLRIPCFVSGCFQRVMEAERKGFLCQIVLSMRPVVFGPKELPPGKCLYFISQGSVHYRISSTRSSLLGPGDTWGWPDLLLTKAKPLRAVTNTYVHTSSVSKRDFVNLIHAYPNAYKAVKTWTLFKEMAIYMMRESMNIRKEAGRLELDKQRLVVQQRESQTLAAAYASTAITTCRSGGPSTRSGAPSTRLIGKLEA
jgi:hypothetical protein